MKVSIKDLHVDMELKNKGIEIDVYSPDGTDHLGDLVITKSTLTWCKGKTKVENGFKKTWKEFIEWAQGE